MGAWDATTVQAASTVVIAVLTLVLVGATIAYVAKTGAMAAEMRRTNDMARRDRERSLRLEAPSLMVAPGDIQSVEGERRIEYRITNHGPTAAHIVRVSTPHGDTGTMQVLPPGETRSAFVRTTDREARDEHEAAIVTFFDPGGTRWRQEPGELPMVDED